MRRVWFTCCGLAITGVASALAITSSETGEASAQKQALTVGSPALSMNSAGSINQRSGYMGAATWSVSNTSSQPASYYLIYAIQVYAGTAWTTYTSGYNTVTVPPGNYTSQVGFYADLGTGIPAGYYNVVTWLAEIGAGGAVGTVLGSAGNSGDRTGMTFAVNTGSGFDVAADQEDGDPDDSDPDGDGNGDGDFDEDPLPNPEPAPGPDPGDTPPIIYPFLPPSGPSGPGMQVNVPAGAPMTSINPATRVPPATPGASLPQ